jgi:hypothetical protein
MMFNETNFDTMRLVMKAFASASRENYQSHSYAAGYYESTILRMFTLLPKRAQKIFIEDMVRATQQQEKEVIARLNENRTVDRVSV